MKSSFISVNRSLLLLAGLFIFSFAAQADPGTEQVNSEVLAQFTNNYSAAKNVTWKVTKEFSKASFTVNNKTTEVFYDSHNRLMATSVCVTLDDLPAGSADKISCDYPRFKTVSAIQYTNAQNETAYFVQLENDKRKIIVEVDEQGNLDCVKSEKK